jgi:hypothetical protein
MTMLCDPFVNTEYSSLLAKRTQFIGYRPSKDRNCSECSKVLLSEFTALVLNDK